MKGKTTFGPGGVRVVFNPNDDDTPYMVYLKDASATLDCAVGEGEVEHHELTQEQFDFLNKIYDQAEGVSQTV
jgi:hypothetical protein